MHIEGDHGAIEAEHIRLVNSNSSIASFPFDASAANFMSGSAFTNAAMPLP
jgi:hypothetical protein